MSEVPTCLDRDPPPKGGYLLRRVILNVILNKIDSELDQDRRSGYQSGLRHQGWVRGEKVRHLLRLD